MLLLTRAAAAPPRRQPRPQPVAADSAMQAAVRARLHNMLADSICDICRTVLPEVLSWVGQPKQVQVELLMANHVLLAITPDAQTCSQNQWTRPTWRPCAQDSSSKAKRRLAQGRPLRRRIRSPWSPASLCSPALHGNQHRCLVEEVGLQFHAQCSGSLPRYPQVILSI